jgi:hypothetical protein
MGTVHGRGNLPQGKGLGTGRGNRTVINVFWDDDKHSRLLQPTHFGVYSPISSPQRVAYGAIRSIGGNS